MPRFLLIADGAGEFGLDFHALIVDAESRLAAAEWATSNEQGYGQEHDGCVMVVPVDDVSSFTINPSNTKMLTPQKPEEILTNGNERPGPNSIPVVPRGFGKPIRSPRRKK